MECQLIHIPLHDVLKANFSSSLNMGDAQNILNNYLSRLNTKLEQAALAEIVFQGLLLSTAVAPLRGKKAKKKGKWTVKLD